ERIPGSDPPPNAAHARRRGRAHRPAQRAESGRVGAGADDAGRGAGHAGVLAAERGGAGV
ncbi:MAG: hypothetical protein AVDCRST_MAG11-830, partial [uncultured Gemmatimonadaceae bacterium]